MRSQQHDAGPARAAAAWAALSALGATAVATGVLLTTADPAVNPAVGTYAAVAIAVLLLAFLVPLALTRLRVGTAGWLAWAPAAVTLGLGLALVATASWLPSLAVPLYRGLHVSQGPQPFWDLDLVLRSVDCASFGFDVYAENNGCLQDPSIYGPGTLWLRFVPFDLASARFSVFLGFVGVVLSSAAVLWLARHSAPIGRIALLVAAAGGSWLLLVERGNMDAAVLWIAIVAVALPARWPSAWAWAAAAAAIWLAGTWKYTPFALGILLLPALRVRRGWIVVAGYAAATLAFLGLNVDAVARSLRASSAMADLGDAFTLGRIPLVSRLGDGALDAWGPWDAAMLALGVLAAAWGWSAARGMVGSRPGIEAPLALAGGTLFASSVTIAGFAYSYKAAFLLLAVPLLSRAMRRPELTHALTALALITVSCLVTWNMTLATIAGTLASGFAMGAGARRLLSGGGTRLPHLCQASVPRT